MDAPKRPFKKPKPAKRAKRAKLPISYHKATGTWYKTVDGKRRYLYSDTTDPTGQLSIELWHKIKNDPFQPKPTGEETPQSDLALLDLCNAFLDFKKNRVVAEELSVRMWDEYKNALKILLDTVGEKTRPQDIRYTDFEMVRSAIVRRYGVNRIKKTITQIRTLFNWAYESDVIEKPMKYGKSFDVPPAKKMRAHKIKRGSQDFNREEITAMLEVANPTQKAMILLGINCAFARLG